ncbi:MAG: hypothetical protein OXG08_02570 [Gammaproteobacteria bacterium]|nr:hypothetical protein [Gammaproteobacteria bacterium]
MGLESSGVEPNWRNLENASLIPANSTVKELDEAIKDLNDGLDLIQDSQFFLGLARFQKAASELETAM